MKTGPLLRGRRAVLGLAALALGVGGVTLADGHDHEHDHDLARRALEQGQVLPLRSVLDKLERELPGQVLKVEFEREDGRFVYKIRLLQPDGRLAKLEVDAVDGRVLRVKRRERGKEGDAHPRR
ncbi:MAG TPA: PepSY domain-containing protein [Rubrivivax sp.]|nr:PepSY domain-containing protein [Burkholderiales bacterium]HNT39682.1 PepSY domain-containing protein [Rubrivivax sp.]